MWNNTRTGQAEIKIDQVCEKFIQQSVTEVHDPHFYYYERIQQNA